MSMGLLEDGPRAGMCMTHVSESYLEANRPKTIVSTRTIPTIDVKTAQVSAELKTFHITILGIIESRWSGSVQK
ncbi:hypothetical protein BgiMline_020479 [Biomphalaria glabrata]|nr:hypothetical protein BgiMline_017687 [Biomphalaria glabrata]